MHDDAQPGSTSPDTLSEATLAPWWHTVAILGMFGLLTIVGGQRANAVAGGTHTVRYVGSLMLGWMTLGTVVAGLYHRRAFFRATLQHNARPWYVEAACGIGIWLSVLALLGILQIALRHTRFALPIDRTVILAIAPQSWAECAMWFCVSVTAGFCEEHVFRGYLFPQALIGCRRAGIPRPAATVIAIVSISALFGVLHLYQGVGGAILISVLGILYCCYALLLGNLRAVIIAHFLQDFINGSLYFAGHLLHR